MLRLNNSSLSRTVMRSGVNSIQMYATFDDVTKGGAVAYFERRPVLDKAGYWVSTMDGVVAKYGKSLCIADNYQCSVQNANERKLSK